MLVVNDVVKRYGKVVANDHVSLKINDGEIGILLGPNGSGKSTLIKCIAGLLKYSGDIEIAGAVNTTVEAKKELGYIPELPALYDTLTVDEHFEFIRRAYKYPDKGLTEKYIEIFELSEHRKKLGKALSKGMQQKVSIVCALLHNPNVIIFDEPMVGLDPHAINELKKVILDLKSQGKSILISTHLIDTVANTWDVVNILSKGKVIATKYNDPNNPIEEDLNELFFDITEHKE